MSEPVSQSRKIWPFCAVGLLLAVVAVVWGVSAQTEDDPASTLPAELSVENLKAQMKDDPSKLRETMHRDDLTEEQRRELHDNMRQVWRSGMDERVDAYYAAATQEDRDKLLDEQIDEFQDRSKEWAKRRAEREKRRKEREAAGEKEGDEKESDRRDWRRERTREERKTDSESRNPDQMARRMGYFTALRKRMQERGIEGGWGGHGGHGGPGRRGGGGGRGGRGGPH
ncbi:MAG: hypothetical protein GY778_22980 [bacterium]|nr:hypothetical protein [bacterium]